MTSNATEDAFWRSNEERDVWVQAYTLAWSQGYDRYKRSAYAKKIVEAFRAEQQQQQPAESP